MAALGEQMNHELEFVYFGAIIGLMVANCGVLQVVVALSPPKDGRPSQFTRAWSVLALLVTLGLLIALANVTVEALGRLG
jgi:hypothetical protein